MGGGPFHGDFDRETAKQGALDRLAAARPGRADKSSEQVALSDAEVEIIRCGRRTGGGIASSPGKRVLGLMAGPVPARVTAAVKAGLLDLIDHATGGGWSLRQACETLEVGEVCVWGWAPPRRQPRSR